MKIRYRKFTACEKFKTEKRRDRLQKKVVKLLDSLLIEIDQRMIDFLRDASGNVSSEGMTPLQVFVNAGFETSTISRSVLVIRDIHYQKHKFKEKKEFLEDIECLNKTWKKYCVIRTHPDIPSYSSNIAIFIEFFYAYN